MFVGKQQSAKMCARQSNSALKYKMLGIVLLSVLFQQILTTQAADVSSNAIEPRKAELDCYRLKIILKSIALRIRRLEVDAFRMSKMPFELAEIDSWCGPSDLQSEMIKRNFDEIDRSNFRGFQKKNFDEIDKVGFRGFMGRK